MTCRNDSATRGETLIIRTASSQALFFQLLFFQPFFFRVSRLLLEQRQYDQVSPETGMPKRFGIFVDNEFQTRDIPFLAKAISAMRNRLALHDIRRALGIGMLP